MTDTIIPNADPKKVAEEIISEMDTEDFYDFLILFDDGDSLSPVFEENHGICLLGHIAERIEALNRIDLKIPEVQGFNLTPEQESNFYQYSAECIVEELEFGNFNFNEISSDFYSVNECWLTTKDNLYNACLEKLKVNTTSPILQKMVMYFEGLL